MIVLKERFPVVNCGMNNKVAMHQLKDNLNSISDIKYINQKANNSISLIILQKVIKFL